MECIFIAYSDIFYQLAGVRLISPFPFELILVIIFVIVLEYKISTHSQTHTHTHTQTHTPKQTHIHTHTFSCIIWTSLCLKSPQISQSMQVQEAFVLNTSHGMKITDCSLHRNTILSTLTSHCQEHTWHYVHLLKYVLMFILTAVNRKNILQVVGSFPTLWFQIYGKAR